MNGREWKGDFGCRHPRVVDETNFPFVVFVPPSTMRTWISHLVRLAFFPVGFLFANCATHRGHVGGATPRPLKTDFTRKFDIVYTPEHWPEALQGDLYRPMMKQAAPGVLLLHFGGWRGDDHRRAMSGIARIFVEAQYEQKQIRDQHGENRSAKLALESEQIAAQDLAHAERCGEE